MKKSFEHAFAVALLTVFVALALGSMGTTPAPSGGGGGESAPWTTWIVTVTVTNAQGQTTRRIYEKFADTERRAIDLGIAQFRFDYPGFSGNVTATARRR